MSTRWDMSPEAGRWRHAPQWSPPSWSAPLHPRSQKHTGRPHFMHPNMVWAPTNVTCLPTSLLCSHHGPTDATHVSYDLYTHVWCAPGVPRHTAPDSCTGTTTRHYRPMGWCPRG